MSSQPESLNKLVNLKHKWLKLTELILKCEYFLYLVALLMTFHIRSFILGISAGWINHTSTVSISYDSTSCWESDMFKVQQKPLCRSESGWSSDAYKRPNRKSLSLFVFLFPQVASGHLQSFDFICRGFQASVSEFLLLLQLQSPNTPELRESHLVCSTSTPF